MVRLKHRYLLVNILYPDANSASSTTASTSLKDVPYSVQFNQPTSDKVDAKSLTHMIRSGERKLILYHVMNVNANVKLQVKYFSPATSTAIIRVSRDHYRLVWAALTFTLQLPKPVSQPCVLQVVRVSGTIRKAEEEAIRRAQLAIRKVQRDTARSKPFSSGSSQSSTLPPADQAEDDVDANFQNGIEDLDDAGDDDDSD
jgi:ribonuclease P/MRP protein subunit POP5